MAAETTTSETGVVQDDAAPVGTKFRSTPLFLWYVIRRWPIIPGVIMFVLVVTGLFAGQLAPYDEIEQDIRFRNAPPRIFGWNEDYWATHDFSKAMFSTEEGVGKDPANRFILGGDHVGRDVLSRTIHGARISLVVTSVALFSGLILGVAIGVTSGYYGGIVDEILMRMVDIWYSVPFLLLAMVAVIIFGASLNLIIVLLILLAWSGYVRNLRGEVLSLKERDFVAAAPGSRRLDVPHHVQAPIARSDKHHLRDRQPKGRAVDIGRSVAQLPRCWHPRPDTGMGRIDRRGQGVR